METRKSWREKLEGESASHGKIFRILIPKPLDVDALIRRVPEGKLVTDEQIRARLAKDYHADKTCSKVTGIFIRIAAEAAEEDLTRGHGQVTPYWRGVKKDGTLNPKFPGGVEAQSARLREEGHTIKAGKGREPPAVEDFDKHLQHL